MTSAVNLLILRVWTQVYDQFNLNASEVVELQVIFIATWFLIVFEDGRHNLNYVQEIVLFHFLIFTRIPTRSKVDFASNII